MEYICIFLLLFQFIFLLRMVMSFFPIREETVASSVREVTMAVTEPVVHPIRQRLPPVTGALAGFGIAELLVLVGIQILALIVC